MSRSRVLALALVLPLAATALVAQATAPKDQPVPQADAQRGMHTAPQTTNPPSAPAAATPAPMGDMHAHHEAMMAQHEKMMAQLAAMDARLDGMVASMKKAKGQARTDAMAALVTELVAQRKQMTSMMMEAMHGGMMRGSAMGHMDMEHGMPMGGHGMAMGGCGMHGGGDKAMACCAGMGGDKAAGCCAGMMGGKEGAMTCPGMADGKGAPGCTPAAATTTATPKEGADGVTDMGCMCGASCGCGPSCACEKTSPH